MSTIMKTEDRLDGQSNFRSWKSRVMIILEDNDLAQYVKAEVAEPNDEPGKLTFKKNMIKAKRIILESVNDHLLSNIDDLNTPKAMFVYLTNLYESKNSSRKVALRSQIRAMYFSRSETISSYFSKIKLLKDQLKAIDAPMDEDELCSTILDSFPDSWDSFCQSVNARSNPRTFNNLFEWCLEEETRINAKKIRGTPVVKEEEEENLALTAKEKTVKPKKKFIRKRNFRRRDDRRRPFSRRPSETVDKSHVRCFACNSKGHFANECPHNSKTKHHAHAADFSESESEEDHEESPPPRKRSKDSKKEEAKREFFFVSALQGSTSPSTWIIDSGASKHMTGNINLLSNLSLSESSNTIVFGNDASFSVEGSGSASFKLKSGDIVHMDGILYVPGLKRNLISVSALEDKGFTVGFSRGKVLVWKDHRRMKGATEIGRREEDLYIFSGKSIQKIKAHYCKGCSCKISERSNSESNDEFQDSTQSTSRDSSSIQSTSESEKSSKKRSASESLDSEGEDSFKERRKSQPTQSELALVSYLSESECIKQKKETIVYDYQVLTLIYFLFQLTHCYGRISFTINEEEGLLRKIMVILYDYQLFSFKEEKDVPVQREFSSELMKVSAMQSQRESTSNLEEKILWVSLHNIDSLSQLKNDEAVVWRSYTVRFKGDIHSDTLSSQKRLYSLCTWMTLNLISEDSALGNLNSFGASSSVSTSLWILWRNIQSWLESYQALTNFDDGLCYFMVSDIVRSAPLQHLLFSASPMVSYLLWLRGSYFCSFSVDDGAVHPRWFSSAVDRRFYYLLWIRDAYSIIVLNVSIAEREC